MPLVNFKDNSLLARNLRANVFKAVLGEQKREAAKQKKPKSDFSKVDKRAVGSWVMQHGATGRFQQGPGQSPGLRPASGRPPARRISGTRAPGEAANLKKNTVISSDGN